MPAVPAWAAAAILIFGALCGLNVFWLYKMICIAGAKMRKKNDVPAPPILVAKVSSTFSTQFSNELSVRSTAGRQRTQNDDYKTEDCKLATSTWPGDGSTPEKGLGWRISAHDSCVLHPVVGVTADNNNNNCVPRYL